MLTCESQQRPLSAGSRSLDAGLSKLIAEPSKDRATDETIDGSVESPDDEQFTLGHPCKWPSVELWSSVQDCIVLTLAHLYSEGETSRIKVRDRN